MSIRNKLKKLLPSYRTENRMNAAMKALREDIREMDKKQEYLFLLSQMQPGETIQEARERLYLKMPKATGRLRNIQLAENYILQRVKQICDRNGLEMFLMGGTLLGALRHKGFIPWDNDVDIGMMAEDYRKLEALLADDPELSLKYYYNYQAGLKMSKVKFRTTEVFFIDIFVFDRVEATKETADSVWKQTCVMNASFREKLAELAAPYVSQTGCRPSANETLDAETAKLETQMTQKLPVMGRGEYICETLDSPFWSREPRGIVPLEEYFPLRKDCVEFEGQFYSAWNHYEHALEHFFGDYWALPFSISEPHTTEFDEGLDEGLAFLREKGIISED